MSVVFYVPLFCALALAASAALTGRRAPPKPGAAVLVAAALAIAVAADASLGVLVGARLLDAAPLAWLLGWRAETPGPIPVPVSVSLIAAGALTLTVVMGWVDWRRSRRALRRLPPPNGHVLGGELIVVRTPAVLAYALPGTGKSPGRILASEGMLSALDAGERRVLLAHERSHLRNGHDRYRRLVRIAARINPLMLPAVGATDFLLERWADEDAARTVGSRRFTARTLARAALANSPSELQPSQAGFAVQRVSGRVNALLVTAPSEVARLALLLPAALAIIASVGAVVAGHDLAHLFDLLRGDG